MAQKTTTPLVQARQWGRIEVFPSAVGAIAKVTELTKSPITTGTRSTEINF